MDVAMDVVLQMFDMMLHIDKYLGIWLINYGTWLYVILFLIIFCETGLVIFPFLPGDSLLFLAGATAASGDLNVVWLMVMIMTAAVLGNTVNYWIGKYIGHAVYEKNWRWLDRDALRKTHDFYEKHGGKTLVMARFIPIVRTFAPFVAGISEMSHHRFQLFNFAGAALWVLSLVLTGFFFGNIPWVKMHLSLIVMIGLAGAIGPIVLGVLWKLLRKLRQEKQL
jgi:membrane-associated protein